MEEYKCYKNNNANVDEIQNVKENIALHLIKSDSCPEPNAFKYFKMLVLLKSCYFSFFNLKYKSVAENPQSRRKIQTITIAQDIVEH